MPEQIVTSPDSPPPWLPPAEVVTIPGRGEFFVRHHRHPDPDAPAVLLLHGWMASSDLQFLAAYEELGRVCSFVGIDHRGHGRGMRTGEPFELEDVADDAAGVVRSLGYDRVIAVGYSMGGPITLHLTRRHPDLVEGIVLQATALEWIATRRERITWKLLPLMGAALRSWTQSHLIRRGTRYLIPDASRLAPYRPWIAAESMRGDPRAVVGAGRALSRYDARAWASTLGVPAGVLVSTSDRLVKPKKQRELASALGATIVEVEMDHLGALERPAQFSSATVELVSAVSAALPPASGAEIRAVSEST